MLCTYSAVYTYCNGLHVLKAQFVVDWSSSAEELNTEYLSTEELNTKYLSNEELNTEYISTVELNTEYLSTDGLNTEYLWVQCCYFEYDSLPVDTC